MLQSGQGLAAAGFRDRRTAAAMERVIPTKIVIASGYKEMSSLAASFVAGLVQEKPDLVMAIPSGRTPVGMYRQLGGMYRKGGLDLSRATFFLLDEYHGLGPRDKGSFYHFIRQNFMRLVNVPAVHVPDSRFPDAVEAGRRYEEEIASAGGLDLAVLGIGVNGHIGFNEPGRPFDSRTGPVNLTPETISANARYFKTPAQVPREAISMGLATIRQARSVLLLASGAPKAEAVAAALAGPVTTTVPASTLQRHPAFTAIVDSGAASLLSGFPQKG